MGDVVSSRTAAQELEDEYPESIIRIWSDGDIELAFNNVDMKGGTYFIGTKELPGDWCVDGVAFSTRGVSFTLTRGINIDLEGDE